MAVLLALALAYTVSVQAQETPQTNAYDNAEVEDGSQAQIVGEGASTALENPLEIDPGRSDPHSYLYAAYPRYARRLDCVIANESRWQAGAYNPRSGATGLAQFLLGTWLSTPQGKAGASRTNPIASIDGAVFLIEQTPQSWHHWSVVNVGLC